MPGSPSVNSPPALRIGHREPDRRDLFVEVFLPHVAKLFVAPTADAVAHRKVAELRIRCTESVERMRIPLVYGLLSLRASGAGKLLVARVLREIADAASTERGVKALLVDHRRHLACERCE